VPPSSWLVSACCDGAAAVPDAWVTRFPVEPGKGRFVTEPDRDRASDARLRRNATSLTSSITAQTRFVHYAFRG
jgi:hypothetical protein